MKTYEKPEMEVIELENDAILTSGDDKIDSTTNSTAYYPGEAVNSTEITYC